MSSVRAGPSTTALGYAGTGNLDLPLDGGLDLKTNPHVLQPPKTTVADNALLSNQDQVRQLPGVTAANATTNVYTGGAVPTIEPYTRGAYFSVVEGKHIIDAGNSTTPVMNLSTSAPTSVQQKSPLAPVYPLTVTTRTFLGDCGLNNISSVLPKPVSAQGLVSGSIDTSKTVVTVHPGTGSNGAVHNLYVSDLTGNTTGQLRYTIEPANNIRYSQYTLTCDPTLPTRFYFAASAVITPSTTLGLVVYSIDIDTTSQTNVITSITRTTIDVSMTYATKLMFTTYQGYSVLVYTNGTTVRAATIAGGGVLSNVSLGSDFNSAAPTLAAFSSSDRLFVGIGNRVNIYTSTGTSGVFTFTFQQTVNIDPNTWGAEAVTGVYNPNGSLTIFSRVFEKYSAVQMSSVGYPATARWINQVMSTQFDYNGTTASNIRSQCFRSEVGAMITTKAFLLQNNGKGMTSSGSAVCPVELGSTFMGADSLVDGTFLSGAFLLDHNCQVIGRYNDGGVDLYTYLNTSGTAGSQPLATGLSEVIWLSEPNNATMFEVSFPFLSTMITGGNTNTTKPASGANSIYSLRPTVLGMSLNLCSVSYQGQGATITPTRCGKSLMLNGGLAMEYDGRTLHESGFHFQASPPGPPVSITTGSAVNPAGVYYYYVVYRWTDSTGQLHQSAPSPARAVNFSSAWELVSFYIWPPIYTYKGFDSVPPINSVSPVYADLYRSSTASDDPTGAVAYRVNSKVFINRQHSAPTGNYLTDTLLVDYQPTSIKTSALQLYTVGQVAANAPPSFIYTVNNKGRCFGLALVGSTYRVYFSSPYSDVPFPFASRWNINGFVTVPPELGDCRSLAALDDKILIFGTQGVAAFAGDGPSIFDTTGSFNYASDSSQINYTAATPLPIPLGTVGCGAPITIPNGVLYQDRQGIMMIDRGLQPTFVGAPVDALTNVNRYGRPYLHPALNSVVFPNAKGSALVYAYELQRFSQWPALLNSVAVFQTADGSTFSCGTSLVGGAVASTSKVYQVRDSNYTDLLLNPALQPTLVLETPWVHIGQGFGGEGSLWEALVTGQYLAPHTLQLEMAYDYGAYEAPQAVSYLTGATVPTVPYQSKFHPPRRGRAEVVRYRLTVTPETNSKATECVRLTGITLFAGAYRATQRVGSGVSR